MGRHTIQLQPRGYPPRSTEPAERGTKLQAQARKHGYSYRALTVFGACARATHLRPILWTAPLDHQTANYPFAREKSPRALARVNDG